MVQIENVDVYGWEAAIRGMRNPKNSWDRMDSFKECEFAPCYRCPKDDCYGPDEGAYTIGPNDLSLMRKLANAGNDHGKFLRMITVTLDINAPLYWWKEFDTYKVGTVANSCSTMHKIHAKEFTVDDFSHEHLDGASKEILSCLTNTLNICRTAFIQTKDKRWWWQMIQLLPSSYNQRRTVQLNYAVLKAMYHARKNHKLDEWHRFCEWVETLPYSELIIGG